jgi:hypothetical protein
LKTRSLAGRVRLYELKYIWMYFATLLKTTAPVKLPISQLSHTIGMVNINPTLV